MQAFGKSQGGTRREDVRFLTGQGRYLADIAPANALHAVFLRAPVAHARITALDVDDARALPGIRAILTGADLIAIGVTASVYAITLPDTRGGKGAAPHRPILATDVMRHVGEPVALVVADTREAAMDALDTITLDYDDLPVALSLTPGGPEIHPEAPGNLALDWRLGEAQTVDAAFSKAAHITKLDVRQNRVTAAPIEPRAALADWDGTRLHMAFNGQGVWRLKSELAAALALDPENVHVATPDVGGGFGMKVMVYPEHYALAAAARQIGQPILWVAERGESIASDNGARDLGSTAELAFDADHKIIGYRVRSRVNLGAYNSQFGQNIQTVLFSKVLTGIYDIRRRICMCWPSTPTQHPSMLIAAQGGPKPSRCWNGRWTWPRASLACRPSSCARAMSSRPTSCPIKRPWAKPSTWANSPAFWAARAIWAMRRAFPRAVTPAPRRGCCAAWGWPIMSRRSWATPRKTRRWNLQRMGARGGGTGGSRSVTVQSTATYQMTKTMVTAFADFLARHTGAGPFEFESGIFAAPGTNQRFTLLEAAEIARSNGAPEILRHDARITLDDRCYPNGAHLCEVEIDPETGALRLDRYLAVDDFGNLMHPMLAEGQVHGGIAQGFGQAVLENLALDADGQILSGSFMDYAMPRASDLPMIGFESVPVPSKNNPLGMKGCGEAGTVGALAALSNAALDALWDQGVRHVDMPLTPQRIWGWLQQAKAQA